MKRILVLDISDHVAGPIGQMLSDRGCQVYRPESLIEFSHLVALNSFPGIWFKVCDPDIILNVHSQDTPQIRDVCEIAEEMLGIRVMNSPKAVALCGNRARLNSFLHRARIGVPYFFYGHPTQIPEDFGEEVVMKDLRGHLVLKVRRDSIISRDELVYCERVSPDQGGTIRTVYWICGEVFTISKEDALKTRHKKPRHIIANDTAEVEIAGKIQALTGLDFLNVDFMGGLVIDVNAFPNFFSYTRATEAVVKAIIK